MADANYDASLKIGLEADLSGGVQTEKQLDQLKRKAREFGKDGENSVGTLSGAFGKLRGAVGLVKNVLAGFGVLGVFTALTGAVGHVIESFGKAKREAEELAKAKDEAARTEAIEALAKAYADLGTAARDAADAVKHENEMQDIATKNARALEDAQIDLAEQKELSAVDANDPAAAEKRALITASYASRRGGLSASRAREDIATEFNRLHAEAAAKRGEARRIESSTEQDDEIIADTKRRLADAENRSKALNDRDVTGFWSGVGTDLKRFAKLNWGEMYKKKTEKGDAIRKDAAAEAQRLKTELRQLEEQKAAKQKEAEALRTDAARLDQRAGTVYAAGESIDVRETATAISNRRSVDAAEERVKKRRAEQTAADLQHNADRSLIASAPEEEARMQAEADAAQARLNEADAARSARLVDVQHRRTLGRVSDGAASREVAAAEIEFKKVEAEVGAVLTRLREEMKSFQAELRKAESREQSYKEGA